MNRAHKTGAVLMAGAALQMVLFVYGALRREGTQKGVLPQMQTRVELYDVLGYHDYERKLDELFARETPPASS